MGQWILLRLFLSVSITFVPLHFSSLYQYRCHTMSKHPECFISPRVHAGCHLGEKPEYSHARGRMCFMHVKCVTKSECVCSTCSKVQHTERGVALESARTPDLPLSDVIGTLHGTWGTRTDTQGFANQKFTNG